MTLVTKTINITESLSWVLQHEFNYSFRPTSVQINKDITESNADKVFSLSLKHDGDYQFKDSATVILLKDILLKNNNYVEIPEDYTVQIGDISWRLGIDHYGTFSDTVKLPVKFIKKIKY